MIDLAAKLSDVLAEGREASGETEALCRRLDMHTAIVPWTYSAGEVIKGRLSRASSEFNSSLLRPGELEAAERSLAGGALTVRTLCRAR